MAMQSDGAPVPLHPGDLGWHWRSGAAATAAATRTWSRDGRILAVGMLDDPRLLRLAVAPSAQDDVALAQAMAIDIGDPRRGLLPDGDVRVEVRAGERLRRRLMDDGWRDDEPWTPLRRDLTDPVPDCGIAIDVVGSEHVGARVTVQRAAFANSTFTEERWHAMAAAPPYAHARCLLARDAAGTAVAAVTVWSAGAGRPGLLEPMGVHRDHRGRGHGRAVTVAAAAALREMGCSSATVCTASSNVAAVATYQAAGFRRLPDVRDLRRVSRR